MGKGALGQNPWEGKGNGGPRGLRADWNIPWNLNIKSPINGQSSPFAMMPIRGGGVLKSQNNKLHGGKRKG